MIRILLINILLIVMAYASGEYSMLYKVEKGSKKLGYYEVNFAKESIDSYSYGAANRLTMFSTKRVNYEKDGFKTVTFSKNKKVEKFNVVTKISALDKSVKKELDRKFKKVKGEDMLFITKEGKKRVELFNKRKIIIKTLDELLSDIYYNRINYTKFILFDKLGVMKMIAEVKKDTDSITIVNGSKSVDYMKIELKGTTPISIKSLVSNWSLSVIKSGEFKEHEVDLNKIVSKSYRRTLSDELQSSTVEFDKSKKTKSYYELTGTISYALSSEMAGKKSYKQKEHCKKLFKKSRVKFKKITLEDGFCKADIKFKVKTKKLKKTVLEELTKEYKQLKITKKIKFNKNSITYEVL